ncbi:MAG TPA: hypothetical protein VH985_13220 [Candidatus Binatia bacterium]
MIRPLYRDDFFGWVSYLYKSNHLVAAKTGNDGVDMGLIKSEQRRSDVCGEEVGKVDGLLFEALN